MSVTPLGLLLFLVQLGAGVIVYVEAPKLVLAGSSVSLLCMYDLQGERLYSVKWYREHYEFFRYIPEQNPSTVKFPSSGINVDLSSSNANQITIQNILKNLSGNFLCEVSAEGPKFITACDSTNISVTEMSIRKPLLKISSSVYPRGSAMFINCSAQATTPPPKIAFFLNDIMVEKRWVEPVSPGTSVLKPTALDDAFINEVTLDALVWIRCEAYLVGVYHLTSASVPVIILPQLIAESCSQTVTSAVSKLLLISLLHVFISS